MFNGIDRDSKCILIPFEDRTVDTLVKLVKQYIKRGTTIISDCGRAYSSLNSEDLTHFTVNHSVNFIYSDFIAHTKTKLNPPEGPQRNHCPKNRNSKALLTGTFKYCIRKLYLNDSADLFLSF